MTYRLILVDCISWWHGLFHHTPAVTANACSCCAHFITITHTHTHTHTHTRTVRDMPSVWVYSSESEHETLRLTFKYTNKKTQCGVTLFFKFTLEHETLSDRLFSPPGPSVWNSLPQTPRHSDSSASFKSGLNGLICPIQ